MSLAKTFCVAAFVTSVGFGGGAAAYAQVGDPVLGAIGDSISAGTNTQRLGDNRDLSWTTGTKPESESHLKKLTAKLGRTVIGKNEAVAGAKVADLSPQIDRVLRASPDFLTITIGANDVCSWGTNHAQDLATFERGLEAHIQRIVEAEPNVRIYLASIPDMYNLWEVSHTRSGCQTRWNLTGLCSALLGRNVTDLQRQAFVGRWRDANDAIAAVASRFAENVFYDPAMGDTQFEWQHVSGVDCFHPSVAGQNLLSEKTWESDWVTQ